MTIGLVSFTKNGAIIREKLKNQLEKEGYIVDAYLPKESFENHKIWIARMWEESEIIIYIGATGIAVRSIAPLVKDKMTDPAVLVIDELGNYCISLLSGHVGGGNEWTHKISNILNATPIITTATDLNNAFAVDVFAKKNNLLIGDRVLAKEVSAKILDGTKIPIISEVEIKGQMPKDLYHAKGDEDFGIYVGTFLKSPFKTTLYLIPKAVFVGLGCRKNKETDDIENLFCKTLSENNIMINAVNTVSSIDLKSEEQGILSLCDKYKMQFVTFSAKQLLEVCGEFTASEFVKSITTVDNVCERSAVLSSGNSDILQRKVSLNGVTVAISIKRWSASYE